jgi:hypothetical protein
MELYLYSPYTPSQGEEESTSIFFLLPVSANTKLVFRDVFHLRIATSTSMDRIMERLENNMHKQLKGAVQRIVHVTLYSTSVECCNTDAVVSSRLVNRAQADRQVSFVYLKQRRSAASQFAF